MKKYRTTKEVTVEEMTRLEYVKSRGWTLPKDEQHLKDEVVFKVFCKDGYVSMCPKDVFLRDATEIKNSHIERMEEEYKELDEKITKASEFLTKETKEPKFTDSNQRDFLKTQLNYMVGYRETLKDRIKYDSSK